jgi:hypothetical protein
MTKLQTLCFTALLTLVLLGLYLGWRDRNKWHVTQMRVVEPWQEPNADDHGVVTVELSEDLKAEADHVSVQYFHRPLPKDLGVAAFDLLGFAGALGMTLDEHGRPSVIVLDKGLVEFSTTLTDCVLAHELSHVYIGPKHGHDKSFRAMFARAIKNGACGAKDDE